MNPAGKVELVEVPWIPEQVQACLVAMASQLKLAKINNWWTCLNTSTHTSNATTLISTQSMSQRVELQNAENMGGSKHRSLLTLSFSSRCDRLDCDALGQQSNAGQHMPRPLAATLEA